FKVAPRAVARVHESCRSQPVQRVFVHTGTLALSDRDVIGGKSQPLEVGKDRLLVATSAALTIVILDAQQHAAAACARDAPDVNCVDDVAEVEEAGGGRGEPG